MSATLVARGEDRSTGSRWPARAASRSTLDAVEARAGRGRASAGRSRRRGRARAPSGRPATVVVAKPLARRPFSRKEARRGSSSAIRMRFMGVDSCGGSVGTIEGEGRRRRRARCRARRGRRAPRRSRARSPGRGRRRRGAAVAGAAKRSKIRSLVGRRDARAAVARPRAARVPSRSALPSAMRRPRRCAGRRSARGCITAWVSRWRSAVSRPGADRARGASRGRRAPAPWP